MRLPSRIASYLVVATTLCATAVSARDEVRLYPFANISTDSYRKVFVDFGSIVGQKIPDLSAELYEIVTSQEVHSILDELKLCGHQSYFPDFGCVTSLNSPSNLAAFREEHSRNGLLGIMDGNIEGDRTLGFSIKPKFFLGNLKGVNASPFIKLRVEYNGSFKDTTTDAVSIAIMYALANSISEGCNNPADFFAIMSRAHSSARTLAMEIGNDGNRLVQLIDRQLGNKKDTCGW